MQSHLHRLVWAKGMLLTPQHFQSHSRYVEDTHHFRFDASLFANRGVSDVAIDEDALRNGEFVVNRLRAIMPDGTPINCPSTHEAPAKRSIDKHFPQNQDVLDVYMALPERVQGQNVALNAQAENPGNLRYTARASDVRDENGAPEERPVQFAHENLQILFGSQRLDGYDKLRIAQIGRLTASTAKGQFGLREEFIPPLLDIAASPALLRLLSRQIEILGTKAKTVSSTRSQHGKSLANFTMSETASFWLLHTINAILPELIHVAVARHGHPEPLYVSMLRLAGSLATFSNETDVRSFPVYNHEDLASCFYPLDARIRNLLEIVLPENCVSIPLRRDGRYWTGSIADEKLLKGQFCLAVTGGPKSEDLVARVPHAIKIASRDEVVNMVKVALPGVTLLHGPPPNGVPFRMENQYFTLIQSGRLWDGISLSRTLGIHVQNDLDVSQLEMYVVLA